VLPVAAAAKTGETAFWIAVVGAVLIVVLIAGWLLLTWYRRRILAPPRTAADGSLWTLDELRQLKNDGLIGEEEFNRLRTRLLDSFRAVSKSGEPAAAPPAPRDAEGTPAPPKSGPASAGQAEQDARPEHKNDLS